MPQIVKYNLTEELEHGLYVSAMARELARELELDEKTTYELALAGLFHDIGKLRLANYLHGGGQRTLVVEEMKFVRMHPRLSWEILKDRRFSRFVLDSVLSHHEDYDGSGYPANLKGEAIPIGGRILRCCDVFAALTSDRPYRKRFEVDEAVSLMIDEINHFDVGIFLAFERVIHRVGTSHKISLHTTDEEILGLFGENAQKEVRVLRPKLAGV